MIAVWKKDDLEIEKTFFDLHFLSSFSIDTTLTRQKAEDKTIKP